MEVVVRALASLAPPQLTFPSRSLRSRARFARRYFVKIVPTSYTDSSGVRTQTNSYSHTERFRPLLMDMYDEDLYDGDEAGHHVPGNQHSLNHGHHLVNTGVLPGVFFVYEINPFAIETDMTCRRPEGGALHFAVRAMSVTGGVYTVSGWLAAALERVLAGGLGAAGGGGGGRLGRGGGRRGGEFARVLIKWRSWIYRFWLKQI
jgi:hypothetical protein